jgi:predicted Rossmann fold flavoprotein
MASVIIVGAGPAGMMSAIRSAQLGHQVILLEKNKSLGKKLLLTGKGRCNITNSCLLDDFIKRFSKNGQFLRDAFKLFFVDELIEFFQTRGLRLKIERQKRVFPCTDSSFSVLDILKKELSCLGIGIHFNSNVKKILSKDKQVWGVLLAGDKTIKADKVVLATGGISYPFTGSTGQGHKAAHALGHKIEDLRPALVALTTRQERVRQLEGLSLKNIKIKFTSKKKTLKSSMGEVIFTANGVSGPLILSLSADALNMLEHGGGLFLDIDLKPALGLVQIEARLLKEAASYPARSIRNTLRDFLPVRMIEYFLQEAGIDAATKACCIKSQQRKRIALLLKSLRFEITGSLGIEKAMITRGGISLKQIDPKTMQSRLVRGLYFAGEIIDVDADTGGFNLQAAFSTGYLAGNLL